MRTSRAGSCSSSAGFTLAELVVVITIIAVMTGLVMPYLPEALGGRGMRSVTRQFSGMLGEARNEALMSGAQHGLLLDMEKGLFWIERLEAPVGGHTAAGLETDAPDAAAAAGGAGSRHYRVGPAHMLPEGMLFAQVAYAGRENAATGVALVRILADGMAEPAIIGLTMGGDGYSLRVRPYDAGLEVYRGIADFQTLAQAETME